MSEMRVQKSVKYRPDRLALRVGATVTPGKELSKEEAKALPPGTLVDPKDYREPADLRPPLAAPSSRVSDAEQAQATLMTALEAAEARSAEAADTLERVKAVLAEAEATLARVTASAGGASR